MRSRVEALHKQTNAARLMSVAKVAMSSAAMATLKCHPDAPAMAEHALELLRAAYEAKGKQPTTDLSPDDAPGC